MPKDISIIDAMYEAQKIAFGPLYFQAIIAMKKLRILELISKHRAGISRHEISEMLNIRLYGVEVLTDAGIAAGLLEAGKNDKIKITKTGAVINSDPLTNVNLNFVNDICYDAAKFTEKSILNGKPEGLKVFGDWDTVYQGLSELPKSAKNSWFEFDHFYSDGAFTDALEIVFENKPNTIFDIGGNTGKWAINCCSYDKQVKVNIFDLEGQLNVARANIAEKGYADRVFLHKANILDEDQVLPRGADVVWMSQFLDCFSKAEIVKILKKVQKAAHIDTDIYILEPFIDNQNFPAAAYSLIGTSLYFTSVANGNSRMYSKAEIISLANEARLKLIKEYPLIGNSFHTILHLKKIV